MISAARPTRVPALRQPRALSAPSGCFPTRKRIPPAAFARNWLFSSSLSLQFTTGTASRGRGAVGRGLTDLFIGRPNSPHSTVTHLDRRHIERRHDSTSDRGFDVIFCARCSTPARRGFQLRRHRRLPRSLRPPPAPPLARE